MEIWHHVIFTQESTARVISDLGIRYEGTPPNGIGVFDIAESDPNWRSVSKLILEEDLTHFIYTLFREEEVLGAEWLRMNVAFEQGYPQPEGSWEESTLNFDHACPKCLQGALQKNDFQIKKEPHLGKKDFVSPISTAAAFASQRVFEAFEVNGIRGYEKRPVIIRSTRKPAQTVSQIYVPQESGPGLLDKDKLRTEVVRQCGHLKLNRIMKGKIQYRAHALPSDFDMVRTHEWFGSGGLAFQEILVSSRVAKLVVQHGWKGVFLDPLELH